MIKIIIASIGTFIGILLIGIFITWQPDFSKWHSNDRMLVILLAVAFSVLVGRVTYEEDKD